jgi:trk system potassium uptake protein TrkA
MKSILIIGLGRFGSHLCRNLAQLDNEIMIVDQNEELLEPLLPYVTSAKIGDCTKEEVLKSLGVGNFDKCFVCIGTNFQSSLEITCLLKELGAKYVISKATRDVHAKFLLRNGADEIIYPDRDIAEKCAVKYSSDSVIDFFELSKDFSIYELKPLKEWIGKSILELNFRNRYHVSIIAIKNENGIQAMPLAEYCFHENEHLMIIGRNDDIRKLVKKYPN